MAMDISGYTGSQRSDRFKFSSTGALFGLAGMSAYFLPVTKDRFVKNAFIAVKHDTQENIERLNEAAIQISNKKLKPDNKLFLAQFGVAENVDAINNKCIELKKAVTDSEAVKVLKQSFADNFKSYKKSAAAMDDIAARAFSRIRWMNFGWGAFIGYTLGHVLGSKLTPNMTYPVQE